MGNVFVSVHAQMCCIVFDGCVRISVELANTRRIWKTRTHWCQTLRRLYWVAYFRSMIAYSKSYFEDVGSNHLIEMTLQVSSTSRKTDLEAWNGILEYVFLINLSDISVGDVCFLAPSMPFHFWQAADVSNPTRPMQTAKAWNNQVYQDRPCLAEALCHLSTDRGMLLMRFFVH